MFFCEKFVLCISFNSYKITMNCFEHLLSALFMCVKSSFTCIWLLDNFYSTSTTKTSEFPTSRILQELKDIHSSNFSQKNISKLS